MGLPINDEGRARADAWQISIQTMPERQCILYTSQYLVMGPQSFKMLPDIDPISGRVIAWRITGKKGEVPHYLPNTNPFVDEMAKLYGIPLEAVRGGAMTMYPEYRKKIKDAYKAPEKCAQDCGGPVAPPPAAPPATPAGAKPLPPTQAPNR
jgi:hypothetical protein